MGFPRAFRDHNGHKRCSRCATFQPEAQFCNSASAPDNLHSWCRSCLKTNDRYRRYGISRAIFDAMLAGQGGRCAICRSPDPGTKGWCLDHDHACCGPHWTCGKCNRGILCGSCNKGLGHFRDNPENLQAAIDYLERAASMRGAIAR